MGWRGPQQVHPDEAWATDGTGPCTLCPSPFFVPPPNTPATSALLVPSVAISSLAVLLHINHLHVCTCVCLLPLLLLALQLRLRMSYGLGEEKGAIRDTTVKTLSAAVAYPISDPSGPMGGGGGIPNHNHLNSFSGHPTEEIRSSSDHHTGARTCHSAFSSPSGGSNKPRGHMMPSSTRRGGGGDTSGSDADYPPVTDCGPDPPQGGGGG